MLIFQHSFLALQTKLHTCTTTLRFIDLWNEEVNMYREEYPIPMPAVFIEFLPVTWNTIGSSTTQHGYGTIKIHVVQNIITDTASVDGVPLPTQAMSLQRFEVLQAVHNTLQLFTTAYFEALDRIASFTDHNHDGVIVDIIEYRTKFKDVATSVINQAYNTIVLLPDVTVQPNTVPASATPSNTGGILLPS